MPEYLVCYLPYSKTVQGIYKVKEETSANYRIQLNDKCMELISKRTLRPRGSLDQEEATSSTISGQASRSGVSYTRKSS